ncbi:hypothetical protein Z946_3406 [Sulfitobacter noctilucicola]|nr:hypothetical protein Z946_3406 [Sulfitobacter noctilucicola]
MYLITRFSTGWTCAKCGLRDETALMNRFFAGGAVQGDQTPI